MLNEKQLPPILSAHNCVLMCVTVKLACADVYLKFWVVRRPAWFFVGLCSDFCMCSSTLIHCTAFLTTKIHYCMHACMHVHTHTHTHIHTHKTTTTLPSPTTSTLSVCFSFCLLESYQQRFTQNGAACTAVHQLISLIILILWMPSCFQWGTCSYPLSQKGQQEWDFKYNQNDSVSK